MKHTYTADIVITDCYGLGETLVGDVAMRHPNNPSRPVLQAEQRAVRLHAATRGEADKQAKLRAFLDARRGECGVYFVHVSSVSRIREKIDTFFSGRHSRLRIKFGDRIGMVSCRRYPQL